MMKSLLWLCLLATTAQGGTGGGTSTPPARGGLAVRLAQSLSSMQLPEFESLITPLDSLDTRASKILVSKESLEEPSIIVDEAVWNQLLTISSHRGFVCILGSQGPCQLYIAIEGEKPNLIILQHRRELIRKSLSQP